MRPSDDAALWRGRNVFVTGAGGFVASWLCRALVDGGANVVGLLRDSAGERLLQIHRLDRHMVLVRGDVTDYLLIERILNEYEIDHCFHLAAQALVVAANRSPLSTFESNIRGTWHVLEAARRSETIEGVVVASSDKAYGNQAELPYRESSPLQGRFPYDVSKACTDLLASSYAETYELPVAITRFANIYGGADLNWSRIIPGTIRSALRGERPIIRSDGSMERDYVHIQDALAGYLRLGMRSSKPGIRGQAFNFGSGVSVSVLRVAEMILEAVGSKLEPHVLGTASGEIDRQFLDSALASRVLGWAPTLGLREGLEATVEWYRNHFNVVSETALSAVDGGT